ncbi:MAG TPA: amidohydrolase family protein, partial [Planctomycetota bacterium]|nr:amidohydrolase family protein [Planctomycetota bacterium]
MLNRREFLGTAATVALAGCSNTGTSEASASIPIVDTHQHLWDLGRFRLPWLSERGPLARNHLPADYLEAFRGIPLDQAVYMEVDVAADQKVAEAEYILALCNRPGQPTRAAVIGGRPADDGFAAYLDRFRGKPRLKGVRQVLFTGGCLEPAFVKGIRLLGDRGLSFDLCMPPKDLPDGAKLVDLC